MPWLTKAVLQSIKMHRLLNQEDYVPYNPSHNNHQAGYYNHTPHGRTAYQAHNHPQTPMANNNNAIDTGVAHLSHLFGGMNMQNQQAMGHFSHGKGQMPAAYASGLAEHNGLNRAYNSPFVYFPQDNSWAAVNQAAIAQAQAQAGIDASSTQTFLPATAYINYAPAGYMVPASYQGYQDGLPEESGLVRRTSWSSNEEKGPKTPMVNLGGHIDYQPNITVMDRSPVSGQFYQTPSPQTPSSYVQVQFDADKKYVPVDLDALAQQYPPIPPPVPAAFTPQDNVTLVKCLENREGITNVYIRGFMPNTTDEMLRGYAQRYGEIDTCKAMIDHQTKQCKGYVGPGQS